ncbi:MAG: MotA/TolQ/ExbB proton channel family protein [Coriobacteriales bacterium]|jgi:biopolymer transport protein ExbB/TolQ|nr:MotA/TolQ/ExbB proton channel family protein [Coriobacteriales bacterium]
MEMDFLHSILRAAAEALLTPVIVALLLFMTITLVMLGSLVVETLTENRRLRRALPALSGKIRSGKDIEYEIECSHILRRQKRALLEIITTKDITPEMRESLAARLVEKERAYYDRITFITDVIARLGPAFGLIATLIPLGPGVVALGSGDTATLSAAMLTAFDATAAGLISSGVSFIVSGIRKRMYASYLSNFELIVEYLMEVENAA